MTKRTHYKQSNLDKFMKIVNASFFYNQSLKRENEVLEQQYTVTGWAEALARKGAEVMVLNRFYKNGYLSENNIVYQFYNDKSGGRLRAWQIPFGYFKLIRKQKADIIHLHHLSLPLHTLILRLLISKKTAIVVQHHGGKLPGKIKRMIYNFFTRTADGFFFTTTEQGDQWFLKERYKKVFPVMEGATFFNYSNRNNLAVDVIGKSMARNQTRMSGNPVFLWVGRLDENKDPLTVLDGFQIILQKYPDANLYMIFNQGNLENEVRDKIESNSDLKMHAHLLGEIAHQQIEWYYRSADYFLLGSHYEGSGYALSEALKCGCIPIVTDIPSFRMMTNNASLGAIWGPGNKESLIKAIEKALNKDPEAEAKACSDFFESYLSFDAIATTAIQHYETILNRRRRKFYAELND
ncbi:MAG: glycosyltransferase family 4 protein [Chitinophagaceae bacterium]